MQSDGNFTTACTTNKAFYKPCNLQVIQRTRNNAINEKTNSDTQLVFKKKLLTKVWFLNSQNKY